MTPNSTPLLLASERLTEAPTSFEHGPLQLELDAARSAAGTLARERLKSFLTISLDPDDGARPSAATPTGDASGAGDVGTADAADPGGPSIRVGNVGFPLGDLDALSVVRRAIEGSRSSDHPSAVLVSTETAAALDRSQPVDERNDPRRPSALMRRLDEGWQLRVVNPEGLPAPVRGLLDEIALVHGAADAVLAYGIRSALGGPPRLLDHPQLIVQLSGSRSVMVQTPHGPEQFQTPAGRVAYIEPQRAVYHLPLDLDSLHLEVPLPALPPDSDRSTLSMLPVRPSDDASVARGVVAAAPDVGWPMRMVAPGGVHVVSSDQNASRVVVGGTQLDVGADGLRLVVELAGGGTLTGADLAASTRVDAASAVTFCEQLWELGLLQPAQPSRNAMPNERLTQVASAAAPDESAVTAGVTEIRGLIDATAWRAPLPGEVHHGDHLTVDVQDLASVPSAAGLSSLVETALGMNQQFFRADVSRMSPHDPLLVVRVRPGSGDAASWLDALGNDTLGPHSTRKVTFVMSLSEADGGWIHLPAGSNATVHSPGSISAWVSLRPWTLEPLSSGERLFLIGRLHGPAYR